MSGHDIIVVGASAGGVEVLAELVRNLPPDLPAAIFVVLHIPAHSTSVLPKILNRNVQKRQGASLEAVHPQDKEVIQHGRIYVAPPDHHLLVKNGYIRTVKGPKENSHRPAVDPLFRTAARAYGRRVVGIVLSGTLDDGTAGLAAVKERGGVAIVQDPDEALYSGMPLSAIENVEVDHILRISGMAPVLVELADKQVLQGEVGAVSKEMEIESDIAELEVGAMQTRDRPGTPSPFACPDCAGVLWEIKQGKITRFRCRTGHAFSVNTLLAEQSEATEEALWMALRALEERAALVERLGSQARERNQNFSAKRFEQEWQHAQQRAKLVRKLLLKGYDGDQSSTANGSVVGEPPSFPIVVICAPEGGMEVLSQVLSALPADFRAPITVVHIPSLQQTSERVNIADERITAMKVKQAEQGELLSPGTIYVAPPNQHLLVNPDKTLYLSDLEFVHFARPSTELLLESVAATFKQRAIAVVLTGGGINGIMGVRAIKKMGGTVIAEATTADVRMPSHAIDTNIVDWVVPRNEIAATLVSLVSRQDEKTYQEL